MQKYIFLKAYIIIKQLPSFQGWNIPLNHYIKEVNFRIYNNVSLLTFWPNVAVDLVVNTNLALAYRVSCHPQADDSVSEPLVAS